MKKSNDAQQALALMKQIFHDQPDLLNIVTLSDLASQELSNQFRHSSNLFAEHVNLYAVGRTHAGKTTVGNMLFGQPIMTSTGRMNCTNYIGLFCMKSNLWFFDTAGAGSDEQYENITRAALQLKQIEREHPLEDLSVHPVSEIPLEDYTAARKNGEEVTGMVRSIFSLDEWKEPFSSEFAPDIILYVVAPHMLFLKDDKHYLYDMLKMYGEKVLIALNIWYTDGVKVTTQANIEDARKEIDQIYRTLYRDGSIRPRFVEVNACTGSGIPELTEQICRMLPPKKLGKVQKVLRDDLKTFAERERDRRFLSTLNRIAARLALYSVDQKVGQDDLIYLAAQGIAHYANTTFKGPDEHINIDHVVDKVKDIQRQQSESITRKEVRLKEKPLYERVPVLKEFTTTKQVKQQIEETVYENKAKRGWDHLEARVKNAGRRISALFGGASAEEWKKIDQETHDNLVYKVAKKQTREIEVPVTEVEQKVVGYENQIVDTIEVVDRVVEVEVGRRALAGSFPVIVFLVGLGLGVRAFCLHGPARTTLPTQIEQQQQQVQLALGSEKHHLDRLIRDGAHAEKAMVVLLDARIAIHDAQS